MDTSTIQLNTVRMSLNIIKFLFSFLEIETSFMPWLMEKTMTQVNQLVLGRTLLDSIIRDVVNQRIDDYEKLAETLQQVNQYFI